LARLNALAAGGLAHGDAELHNIIVCPSPLEPVLVDFEAAVLRESMSELDWAARLKLDVAPLLREAVYLQCVLGRQPGALGELAWDSLAELFRSPERFRQAIAAQAEM
ncbi:MAG: hypothetical protein ABUR63_09520, partial [Verrucomicrobiota bacterium]